ncbi:ATPase [Aureococcus anophagefferens]|nr:ATPase [Aureococcus anophagefferens]
MSGRAALRRVVAANVRVRPLANASRRTIVARASVGTLQPTSTLQPRRQAYSTALTRASVGAWSTLQPRRQAYSTAPTASSHPATKAPKATLEETSTALLDDDGDARAAPATVERLLALAEPERRRLAAGLGLQSASSGLSLFLPFAIGKIVDGCARGARRRRAVAAAAWSPTSAATALLGVFGVQAVVMIARQHVLNVAGERRGESADGGVGEFGGAGDRALTTHLASAASSTFSAIGAVAMLFSISPSLALLSLAVFPPVFLFASWRGRRMRKAQKKVQESLASANGVAQRTLGNLRTLRALGCEDSMEARYRGAVGAARREAISVGDESAVFGAVVHFAANVSILVVLAVGGEQVMSGALSPGSLSSFLMYSLYLGFASSGLSSSFAEFQRASGATERLLALSDRESLMPPSTGVLPEGSGPHAVEFRNVTFSYPTRRGAAPALDGFDLRVAPGERVAVKGASGCGKSTLLRLISRLYDVDGGRVTVGGVDVRALDASFRGGLVGVVPQEPVLLSGTIAENIRLGCARQTATDADVAEAARRAASARSWRGSRAGSRPRSARRASSSRAARSSASPSRALPQRPARRAARRVLERARRADDARGRREPVGRARGKTVLAVAHHDQVLAAIGVDRVVDLTKGGGG